MKNLLFMGLLCLVFSVNLFSQTEPSPLSFNWGTYTAPFHDSSHRITRPVLGWQWGYNYTRLNNSLLSSKKIFLFSQMFF
ncbi:MAG: hypothetical protein ACK5C0_03075 [Candidatus Kapaibacterium sp.]|jgi:hypothetical protein